MTLDLNALGLSEEQVTAVSAEIDRARTQASQTAQKNAEAKFQNQLPELVQAAVDKATADANKTAEQKATEAWEAKFNQLSEALAAAQNQNVRISNEAKIRQAGITDDATVSNFAEMFVSNPDGLDGFLTTYNSAVAAQVAIAQQQAMSKATPPGHNSALNGSNQSMSQASIAQLVKNNAESNGGYIDDAQLFADVRVMQAKA